MTLTPEQRQLVEDNINFAYYMAQKLHRKVYMEYEELVSACLEGLVKAARDYDPDKSKFTTFATIAITHAALNQDRVWRKKSKELHLEDTLNVDDGLNWEQSFSNRERPLDDTIISPIEAGQIIKSAAATMKKQDRDILSLLFVNPALTQLELGKQLGCSQVQVSRRLAVIRNAIQEQIAM